jgi:ribosomal protein S28E/S33
MQTETLPIRVETLECIDGTVVTSYVFGPVPFRTPRPVIRETAREALKMLKAAHPEWKEAGYQLFGHGYSFTPRELPECTC